MILKYISDLNKLCNLVLLIKDSKTNRTDEKLT